VAPFLFLNLTKLNQLFIDQIRSYYHRFYPNFLHFDELKNSFLLLTKLSRKKYLFTFEI
jgi:hypothetical protein